MSKVKDGDTVSVHYTGTLADGTVFDSSLDREPLTFTLGQGQLIKGFEAVVRGMEVGDKATTVIEPEEGYGPVREEMTAKVERSRLPEGIEPLVGDKLQIPGESGQPMVVTVSEVTEDTVTLDANHPLAGKQLTFEIELVTVL